MTYDGIFPVYEWDGDAGGSDGIFPIGIGKGGVTFVAEILIGTTVVWSSNASVVPTHITLNVDAFAGTQQLTFRIRAQ